MRRKKPLEILMSASLLDPRSCMATHKYSRSWTTRSRQSTQFALIESKGDQLVVFDIDICPFRCKPRLLRSNIPDGSRHIKPARVQKISGKKRAKKYVSRILKADFIIDLHHLSAFLQKRSLFCYEIIAVSDLHTEFRPHSQDASSGGGNE